MVSLPDIQAVPKMAESTKIHAASWLAGLTFQSFKTLKALKVLPISSTLKFLKGLLLNINSLFPRLIQFASANVKALSCPSAAADLGIASSPMTQTPSTSSNA